MSTAPGQSESRGAEAMATRGRLEDRERSVMGMDMEPRLRGGKTQRGRAGASGGGRAVANAGTKGRRRGGRRIPCGHRERLCVANGSASRMALRAALRRFDPPRVRAGPRSHRLGRRQRQTFRRAARCRSPCSRHPGGGRRGEQGADGSAWRTLRAPPQTGTQAVRRRAAPTGRGERPLWGSLQVSGGAGWTVLLGTE